MSIFSKPKITPPPSTPTMANASVYQAGQQASRGYSSLIGTGTQSGLTRKASTAKKSLIGGA
jgi:hypothetical protein